MSILSVQDISKRYRFRDVVKGISVEIKSGEVVGLLGPNGAGKTTAFYMIVGLVTADKGRILLDGVDVREYDLSELRRSVGRLHEAHEALEHANKGLAQSNRDLERFAYVAAHVLKEPLRMISSFAELLGESLSEKLSEDEAEYFGFIRDGALRGQRLTSDILQYSKLDQDHERDWIDLDDLLRVESETAAKTGKGTVVWEESGTRLWSSAGLLEHLLHNLISNGLKYNESSKPTVDVKVQELSNAVEITIRVNGIGIEEEHVDNVFDMFFRAHDKASYEGTGIGLAICRRIMELHDGYIGVESEESRGSEFTCLFPVPSQAEVEEVGPHHNIAG